MRDQKTPGFSFDLENLRLIKNAVLEKGFISIYKNLTTPFFKNYTSCSEKISVNHFAN